MIRLQELRDKANISQMTLSKVIGVARSTIAMWESGKSEPDNNSLVALSDFFNVSIDYLLGRSDIKNHTTAGGTKIKTNAPLEILLAQYNISSDILAKITDRSSGEAQSWLSNTLPLPVDAVNHITSFFELDMSDFEHGIIPLFHKESVFKKLAKYRSNDDYLFAAFNKTDFTPEELAKIDAFIKGMRSNQ